MSIHVFAALVLAAGLVAGYPAHRIATLRRENAVLARRLARVEMHNRVLADALNDPRSNRRRPVLRSVPVEARRLELVLDERTEEVTFRG